MKRQKSDSACVHVYGVFALCFDDEGRAYIMICEKRALKKLGIPVDQHVTGVAFDRSMIPEPQYYFFGDGEDGFIQLQVHEKARPDRFDVYQYAGAGSGMRVKLMNVLEEEGAHPLDAVANFIRFQYDDGEVMPTPAEVRAWRRGQAWRRGEQ